MRATLRKLPDQKQKHPLKGTDSIVFAILAYASSFPRICRFCEHNPPLPSALRELEHEGGPGTPAISLQECANSRSARLFDPIGRGWLRKPLGRFVGLTPAHANKRVEHRIR